MKVFVFLHRKQLKLKYMQTPFKETPILYGKDARRFLQRMKEKRTETPEQKAKRIADYEMAMTMLENF